MKRLGVFGMPDNIYIEYVRPPVFLLLDVGFVLFAVEDGFVVVVFFGGVDVRVADGGPRSVFREEGRLPPVSVVSIVCNK